MEKYMGIAESIKIAIEKSSWIRKMFEEGRELKEKIGSENVFDFTIGNPDVEPPEKYFEVIAEIAADKTPGIHGYMPNAGFPSVREKVASYISRQQEFTCSADNIVMTVGAAGGINVIFRTLLNPGDEVIVPKPYFAEYGAYVANHGGKLVTADSNSDFSLSVESIASAITEKTKVIMINSPNNPSGRVYDQDSLNKLAELLKARKASSQLIYLLSDEPYREIVYDGIEVPPLLPLYEETFVVTSFSKTLSLPGERIGFIAQHPQMSEGALIIGGLIMCNRTLGFVNAPAIIQRVVAELLDEHVSVEIYKKRRDIFLKGLKEAGLATAPPDGSFYLFVKSPIDDDVEFVRHLKKYNILAVPGSGFGGPGYIRLAYCIDESVIERAIPLFKKAVSEIKE
jgi:aspartate aminotransferase